MLFPIAIDQSYAQLQNKVIVGGTEPTAPTVTNFDVEVLIGTDDARVITLPFYDNVSDILNADNELTIAFSIPDAHITQFTNYIGTNVTGTDAIGVDDVATVAPDATVTITSALDAAHTADVVIDYTVTNAAGQMSTGTVTLKFVHIIGDIVVTPFAIAASHFDDDTQVFTITDAQIIDTMLAGSMLGEQARAALTLTIASPGDQAGVVALTFSSTSASVDYTPASTFNQGDEIFEYTIALGDKTGTSTITFTLPVLACTTGVTATGIDFGTLGVGDTSDTDSDIAISNTGNANVQVMLKGEPWKSTDASITSDIMSAETTKYSATTGVMYNVKTPLTATAENVGDIQGDAGVTTVYMQLMIDLLQPAFRGSITQEMTVGTTCS